MKFKQKRRLTQKQLDKKVLYFAYGSNMHQPRLESRVGPVRLVKSFALPDYRLSFDVGGGSFANVTSVEDETCEGVIYELTYGQLRMLDQFEGLYDREFYQYGRRKLHYYIGKRYALSRHGWVDISLEYYSLLMLGCIEHKLKKSLAIVSQLKPSPKRVVWERLCIYKEEFD